MSNAKYDVVVVGAGIQGSCTALHLAQAGKNVLLLEQFPLPHTRGSSHGQSRIIRTAYSEDFFTKMMPHAFSNWRAIENESGKELIWNTGILVISNPPYKSWEESLTNMINTSPDQVVQMELKTAEAKYPMIKFDNDTKVYLDATGGVIKASLALQTVQDLFVQHGGEILDGVPVTDIQVNGEEVTVKTSERSFTSSSVVLCCGPWANKVLKHTGLQLPLQPQRVQVCYFKEKVAGQYSRKGGFVTFINLDSLHDHMYGMPSIEYPGLVKVCVHYGVNCDPDERDKHVETNDNFFNRLSTYIETHLPDLEPEPAVVETCMYTVTPDESFILDRHPKYKNIIIGAGFSGSGFKLSPLVGEILGQLAMGIEPKHDMRPFAINRFT